jgi:drug/metabolite transporter (DMT)-like permease
MLMLCILCLESVFALVAGMVMLGEMMSLREIIGCIIMFAAIFVANLPEDALKLYF